MGNPWTFHVFYNIARTINTLPWPCQFFFSQRSILFPSPRQPPLLHFAWGSDHLAEPIPNPSDPHLADHGQADT